MSRSRSGDEARVAAEAAAAIAALDRQLLAMENVALDWPHVDTLGKNGGKIEFDAAKWDSFSTKFLAALGLLYFNRNNERYTYQDFLEMSDDTETILTFCKTYRDWRPECNLDTTFPSVGG